VWDEKSKPLVAEGKLVVVGVVQEQHAERARLYKQWKKYEFPIAQDSTTSLGLKVVPVPILIDEFGFVMSSRPRISQLSDLVNQKTAPRKSQAPRLSLEQTSSKWLLAHPSGDSFMSAVAAGDALLHETNAGSIDEAILQYQKAELIASSQNDLKQTGLVNFRLGVAYRSRFDALTEAKQDPQDFSSAAQYWARALESDPNQYIWRRRIQQYGPQQIKPYPFYDRGDSPIPLTVPLSGAELVQPAKTFNSNNAQEPLSSDHKITRDNKKLIQIHATAIPQKIAAGETTRIHLCMTPDSGYWNNQSTPLVIWIDASEAGTPSDTRLVHPHVKSPSSQETRTLEFEFKTNSNLTKNIKISGYALYYVCDSDDGQCIYRRQDISIPIQIASEN
jgi:tetratricopeptide (TPR) repeat protein